MKRNATHRTRDRYLTPEEATIYRKVREQIEEEKPEINALIKAQLLEGQRFNTSEDSAEPIP